MTTDFTELMLQLQKEYLSELPEKIKYISSLHEKRDLETLRNEFHKMRGTGKSYGFDALSLLGALGEDLLQQGIPADQCIPTLIGLLLTVCQHLNNKTLLDITKESRYTSLKQLLK